VSNLTKDTPRLTVTLTGPRDPHSCASCGELHPEEVWQECDHFDKPEPLFLLLCAKCSKRLIKPHERLYIDHQRNEPLPGTMDLCDNCIHRTGYACSQTKAHGGPGILIRVAAPYTVHLNMGSKGGRWMKLYSTGPTNCTGRVSDVHE
jgi:hypothetical protein